MAMTLEESPVASGAVKEQVVDSVPKRIKELKFGIPQVTQGFVMGKADVRKGPAKISSISPFSKYAIETFTT